MTRSNRLLKSGISVVLCALLVLGGLTAAVAQTIVPINGVPPTLTPVTINNAPGDQYDPHISGNWVAYTSELSIRYYSFATGTDAEVPLGSSARDLLSDISGSKIVFARIIPNFRTAVMVFDAATPAVAPIEIDAASDTIRVGSAIGGDTVAYIDYGLQESGELVVHDLSSAIAPGSRMTLFPIKTPRYRQTATWSPGNTATRRLATATFGRR